MFCWIMIIPSIIFMGFPRWVGNLGQHWLWLVEPPNVFIGFGRGRVWTSYKYIIYIYIDDVRHTWNAEYMYVSMHASMHGCLCVCMHACIYVCMCVCLYVHVCRCVCLHIWWLLVVFLSHEQIQWPFAPFWNLCFFKIYNITYIYT